MLAYDVKGAVALWGLPNAKTSIDVREQGQPNQKIEVDAWKVLYVSVWIRDTEPQIDPRAIAPTTHWMQHFSFVVERWDQIFPFFRKYCRSQEVANRFSWEVERWIWTRQKGWEPDDSQMSRPVSVIG